MDLSRTLASLGAVDLLVLLLVVGGVVGTLRRGGGLLAAAGSVLGSLLVAWLVAVAVVTWGPTSWAQVTEQSALVQAAPVPHRALDQVGALLGHGPGATPAPPAPGGR
jgi:hypothetical protein